VADAVAAAQLLGATALKSAGRKISGGGASPIASARQLALVGLAALALQMALGGWTSSNYAALACLDFPTCQGTWWPHGDYHDAFVLCTVSTSTMKAACSTTRRRRHSSHAPAGRAAGGGGTGARGTVRVAAPWAVGRAIARLGAARGARPAAAHRHIHGAQGIAAVARHGAHRRRRAAAARHAGAAAILSTR